MTPICFPQIIDRSADCPRAELSFSNTPPTCVRVVPVYADEAQVIGEIPPRVHFYITDDGEVYQLAPIQSPPSVPPEYHAVLDSSGCILVGVEFGTVTRGKILPIQVSLLPGVLRYILVTLGLPISSITNNLPPDRCNPQQWQQIITATQNCLIQPPPTPPDPCAFVLQCVGSSTIQVADTPTIDLTLSGNTVSGQVVISPNPGNQLQALPNGLFVPASSGNITVTDTPTVDLTLTGSTLSADVIINSSPNNALVATPTGLFVPQSPVQAIADTPTVDLTLSSGTLSAQVIVSPNPGNQLQVLPNGLFVPPSSGSFTISPTVINGGQGDWVFWDGTNLRSANLNNYHVPYGTTLNTNQGGLYFVPNAVSFQYNDSNTIYTSFNVSLIASRNSVFLTQPSDNVVAFLNQSNVSYLFFNNSSIVSLGSSISSTNSGVYTSEMVLSFFNSANYISLTSQMTGNLVGFDSIYSSYSEAIFDSFIGTNCNLFGSDSIVYSSRINSFFSQNSHVAIGFADIGVTSIESSFTVINSVPPIASANTNYGAFFLSRLNVGLNSIFDVRDSFAVYRNVSSPSSVLSSAYGSLVVATGSSYSSNSPNTDYRDSVVVTSGDSYFGPPNLLPSNVFSSVVVGRLQQSVFSEYNAFGSINVFDGTLNSSSQINRFARGSIIAAVQSRLSKSLDEGSVFAGYLSEESLDNIITVGDNFIFTPQVRSAGGYQILLGRGGINAVEVWRNLNVPQQNLVWFGNNGNSVAFTGDAQASTFLNGGYGTDQRTKFGTFTIVNVAGRPAIFAWDGSSFVRITV